MRSLICAILVYAGWCAEATSECGLSDAADFYDRIENPREEGDPSYVLRTAEAFLKNCPNRPEARDAHLIAARAAANGLWFDRAKSHFANADTRYQPIGAADRLRFAGALVAEGDLDRGMDERDRALSDWAAHIAAAPRTTVTSRALGSADVYRVRFSEPVSDKKIEAIWIAIPKQDAWPLAIAFSRDPMRNAFRRIRLGAGADDLSYLEVRTCSGRRKLHEAAGDITPEDVEDLVVSSLADRLGMGAPIDEGQTPGDCPSAKSLLPTLLR